MSFCEFLSRRFSPWDHTLPLSKVSILRLRPEDWNTRKMVHWGVGFYYFCHWGSKRICFPKVYIIGQSSSVDKSHPFPSLGLHGTSTVDSSVRKDPESWRGHDVACHHGQWGEIPRHQYPCLLILLLGEGVWCDRSWTSVLHPCHPRVGLLLNVKRGPKINVHSDS